MNKSDKGLKWFQPKCNKQGYATIPIILDHVRSFYDVVKKALTIMQMKPQDVNGCTGADVWVSVFLCITVPKHARR